MTDTIRLRVLPALLPKDSPPVEFQAGETDIEWRYVGGEDWAPLVPLEELEGPPGPSATFRSSGGYIQYRIAGTITWINVLPLTDITGPQGPEVGDGNKGDITVAGAAWDINANVIADDEISASSSVVKLAALGKEGAIGDGTTDDSAAFTAVEGEYTALYLPDNRVFNIDDYVPTAPVYGRGSVKRNNGVGGEATVSGFELGYDPIRTNTISNPEIWAEKALARTSSPGIGDGRGYFNTILTSGADLSESSGSISRSTVIGTANLQAVKELERVEIMGNGAMRFAGYAQRSVALGALALQWIGQNLTEDPGGQFYYHDFFRDPDTLEWTLSPSDPAWDWSGLETRNPGTRLFIANWMAANKWATTIGQNSQNVAVGRDAMLHKVKGNADVAIGYQALTNAWETEFNAAVGYMALRDGVQSDRNAVLGALAAAEASDSYGSVYVGYQAGMNQRTVNRSVLIGLQAGIHARIPNSFNDYLIIQSDDYRDPLIAGDFAAQKVVIGGVPGDTTLLSQKLQLHGTDAGSSGIGLADWSATGGSQAVLDFNKSAASAVGTHALVADGDNLGAIRFNGSNGTSFVTAVQLLAEINGVPGASNDMPGRLTIYTCSDGSATLTARALIGEGLVVGTPTGGDKGTGTVNAVAVYDDNALLTCYVMEAANAGTVDLAFWDSMAPTGQHIAARRFASNRMAFLDVDEFTSFWKRTGHLPSLPSRDTWSGPEDRLSTGELIQALWETVELQAVHIAQLRDEIAAVAA